MRGMGRADHFIPISRSNLKGLLLAEAGDQSTQLAKISEMMEALWHHSSHSTSENLKRLYEKMDPDSISRPLDSYDATEFIDTFSELLSDGNWLEITSEEMQAALDGEAVFPISLDVRFEEFFLLKTYRLGESKTTMKARPTLLNKLLRNPPREFEVDSFDRVIQLMQFRPRTWFEENGTLKNYAGEEAKGLHLRLFKNVPKLDLEVLFPNTSPKMRTVDQMKIIAPLIGGLVTLGMKFGPLLFGGGEGETSLALVGGILTALATYILKSWNKYMKTKEAYLSQVSKDLYFKGQANNSAVITTIVDLSEEQEVKEALLAYSFLLIDGAGVHNMESLDLRIEKWLLEKGGGCDFEVDDALEKLVDLKILKKNDGGTGSPTGVNADELLSVLGPQECLSRLDEIWDGLYDY